MPAEAIAEPIAEKPIVPTATDTPPPKPDKPAEKAPTPEELEAAQKKFVDNFMEGISGRKKKPEPKAEEKPVVADKIEPKPEPEKPKLEEKPAKAPEPEPEPTNDEDDEKARIDALVARSIAESGLNSRDKQDEPEPTPEKQPTSRADAKLFETTSAMESMFPGKYEGLTQKLAAFRPVESAYKAKWLKENPSEKFDQNDSQHDEFYGQSPTFSKEDYDYAQSALQEEKAVVAAEQRVMKRIEPKLKQIEFREKMQEIAPEIIKSVSAAEAEIYKVVPEFKEILEKNGGVMDRKTHAEFEKLNPDVYKFAAEVTNEDSAVIAELEKMNRLGANYVINPNLVVTLPGGKRCRPHQEISDTLAELETAILAEPVKDQEKNGRTFLTIDELGQRKVDILQSNLSQREKESRVNALHKAHWTVGASEIKERRIKRSANYIDRLSKKMPSSPPKQTGKTSPKNGETVHSDNTPKETVKPASSGGSDTVTASDVMDAQIPGKKTSEDSANSFLKRMRGG